MTDDRAATAFADEAVSLRNSVIVSDEYVRLGDLFTGTGARAKTVVAYAPEPGQAIAFDARWLYQLARSQGLDWRPMGMRDRAMVRRDSHAVSRDQIEDTLSRHLVREGIEGPLEVVLTERAVRLHLPGDEPATVSVEDMSYDTNSGRFSALVLAPAGDPAAQRIRVSGRYYRLIDVPVLAQRKLPGEIIRDEDVKIEQMRLGELPRDAVSDERQLIGLEAKRGLVPGKAIRQGDLQRPVLINKGSLVTIVLRRGAMLLTARGKALDAGAAGNTIRVTNTTSKSTVEGVVTGAGTVTVESLAWLALN
ncbi:MAG: flagellar basal body P-ring formation chaperone FlgA [Proteobacteria bacterium]|nr:flagellar basal body P-ring formation chaperone FlgA [Pseudomonadota bacterium]